MPKPVDPHISCPIPALLLAAGRGTRLAPLTDTIPKCLVPVHGRPLLDYWITSLGQAGLKPLIVNTHHHAEAVRAFLGGNVYRNSIIEAYEPELLGTGGTLLAQREHLRDGPFMVIHADNLSRFSLSSFLEAHHSRPAECLMTMMLFRTPTPESCGIVMRDKAGIIREFHEKSSSPPGNLANAAVYIMELETLRILADIPSVRPDISLDLIPRCLGRIFSWINADYHRDIGTPESYEAAQKEFRP